MATPARVWIGLAVLYAAFFSWYTSCGGPLTPEEIDRYVEVLSQGGADPERIALWKAFMESDTGDDFAMVNVIDLRAIPLQVEGVAPGETSAQVLRRYTAPFMRVAVRSAAHPVYMGSAAADALDLWGIEGAERWSTGALVRYRSRRDLMEQAVYTRSVGVHDFKIAAMKKTIAFPVDPWFQLGDPRLVLGLLLLVIGLAWHLRSAVATAKAGGGGLSAARAAAGLPSG
jgi:hypothetical protein